MTDLEARPDELVEIGIASDADTIVLTIDGDICLVSVPLIEAAADAAIESGARRLIVDLTDIDLLSAAGLALFGRLALRMRTVDKQFTLRNPRPLPRRVLEIAGFDHLLHEAPPEVTDSHRVEAFGPRLDGDHQARCSCGWRSEGLRSAAAAREAFESHRFEEEGGNDTPPEGATERQAVIGPVDGVTISWSERS
jgi:anti-sigma B factor antagonist